MLYLSIGLDTDKRILDFSLFIVFILSSSNLRLSVILDFTIFLKKHTCPIILRITVQVNALIINNLKINSNSTLKTKVQLISFDLQMKFIKMLTTIAINAGQSTSLVNHC